MAYWQRFGMSDSGGTFIVSLSLRLPSPSIQFYLAHLPKFYFINRPRQFLYSLMVITVHRGESHINGKSNENHKARHGMTVYELLLRKIPEVSRTIQTTAIILGYPP